MANRILGTANTVKKQLNDVWLSYSFDVHKELYNLYVSDVAANGTTVTVKLEEVVGSKLWEKKATALDPGHDGLAANGERVLLVVRSPLKNSADVTLKVPYSTVSGSGTAEVKINPYSSKNMATWLASGTQTGNSYILEDITEIKEGVVVQQTSGAGLQVGDAFKFVSMPAAASWKPQSFIRAITPNEPKNYQEVADHYDGAADSIRSTVINGLTISKVFENIPGSFKVLTDRVVTMKAEMRELDRAVASEEYYFTGVRGTGKVTLNRDGESVTEMEASMVDWITISG